MKVLITGGAGYVGFSTASLLSDLDIVNEVILYDNLSKDRSSFLFAPVKNGAKIRLVKADILDIRTLNKEVAGADVVLHLAARVSTPFSSQDPHLFEQVNHWGTAEVVYACENAGTSRLIYMSSTAVYGTAPQPCTEKTIPAPQSYYAISKRRGEEHVQRLVDKGNAIILRGGNVYGYSPTTRFDAVINQFMFQAMVKGRLTINGDGSQRRSFVHIDEIANALTQLTTTPIDAGIYNYATRNLSVEEVADAVCAIIPETERIYTDQHMPMRSLEVELSGHLFEKLSIPNTDLREELGKFRQHFTFGGRP